MKNVTSIWVIALTVGITASAENRVLSLDGSSGYATVPDDSTLQFTSGDYSLSAWVCPADADTSFKPILSKRTASAGWVLRRYGGNKLAYIVQISGDPKIQGTTGMESNRWYHIAVTFNAGASLGTLYLDGESDGTNAVLPLAVSNTVETRIGFDSPSGGRYFNGMIDDVRICNRCLTRAEVRGLMHEKLTGQETGLLGYWPFDDGTGKDLSPNGRDATLQGTATTTADPATTNGIANAVEIYFNSGSPMTWYNLEATSDLLSPNWTATGAKAVGNGSEQSLFDSTRGASQMFYRVVSE